MHIVADVEKGDRRAGPRGKAERGDAQEGERDALKGAESRDRSANPKNVGSAGTQGRSDEIAARGGIQTDRETGPEFGSLVATEGTERKVHYDPAAPAENDRAVLSEEEAFEDVHPYATAETFEAQARGRGPFPGSADRETAEPTSDQPGKRNLDPRDEKTATDPRRK